jgi:hypothetical protein
MRLAVALLALIGLTHFAYDPIAHQIYRDSESAGRALFYVFRGIEGCALFAFVAALAQRRSVMAVCALGMTEEGLTAACRISRPIAEVPGNDAFAGLCGREWYWVGLLALLLIALGIVYELGGSRGQEGT